MPIISLLEISPLVIAALHLPDFAANRRLSMAWLEDYVLGNARIFAEASISAFKLLDESREPGAVETVALARMIRREFCHSFEESLARIRSARQGGVRRPIQLGGSVTEANVAEALTIASGVIVS